MNNVKVMAGSVAVIVLAMSSVAFAESMSGDAMHTSSMPSSMMMMHPPAPMILSVENNGKGRLRGVVSSVTSTSITVATWGGNWTISTTGDTQILPSKITFSEIKVGDYVGAIGTVSEDAPSLTATLIRDFTDKKNAMMQDSMKKDSMSKGDHMMSSSTSNGAAVH